MRREWTLSLLFLPFAAFSPTRLMEVRSDQHDRCADCGTDTERLQVHHRVPQRYYGTDRRVNAIALCPGCHQRWDALADEGIVYPGVGIGDVDTHCFDNPQVRLKIIEQFGGEG